MLARYQLGTIYASLRRAALSGDWRRASQLLGQALGCELPGQPDQAQIAHALQHHVVRQLSYRGFKPAELAMWRAGLKPVVKMEDIPLDQARRWIAAQAPLQGGTSMALGEPYLKDYLLLRSQPCAASDPQALVCVYAGQPAAIARLRTAEAQQREDAVAAGQILAIPPCCASAFAADFASARADQDALNDDAVRRLIAPARPLSPGPWQLNPLSDAELLGYYPCRLDCRASLDRAAAVLALLQADDPSSAAAAARRLAAPILWWRMPFFAVLQPHPDHGADQPRSEVLRYRQFRFNAFADPPARAVQGLLAAHLAPWLSRGDGLQCDGSGLTILRGSQTLLHLPAAPGMAPLLACWTPENDAAAPA